MVTHTFCSCRIALNVVTLVQKTIAVGQNHEMKRNALGGSRRYYRSWELYPGVWVDVFTRPMFIYGCEGTESRAFLQQQHGQTDFSDYERVRFTLSFFLFLQNFICNDAYSRAIDDGEWAWRRTRNTEGRGRQKARRGGWGWKRVPRNGRVIKQEKKCSPISFKAEMFPLKYLVLFTLFFVQIYKNMRNILLDLHCDLFQFQVLDEGPPIEHIIETPPTLKFIAEMVCSFKLFKLFYDDWEKIQTTSSNLKNAIKSSTK